MSASNPYAAPAAAVADAVPAPDGTVDEILAWVDDDPGRARGALAAEAVNRQRKTLMTALQQIIG